MFFIFARRNYIKLPLVQEAILESMMTTNAPLYHTFCETNIWVDDWYKEHRMCLIRPALSLWEGSIRSRAAENSDLVVDTSASTEESIG